jgi:hypothetical protein
MHPCVEAALTTTSRTRFLTEIAAGHLGPPIPEAKREYFRARLRNTLFNFILRKFLEQEKSGLTKATLARRIGSRPDVISRWLGAPGNLTLDTVSDLLLGISAEELIPTSHSVLNRSPTNYVHADWIRPEDQSRSAQPPRAPIDRLETGLPHRERTPSELLGHK